MTNHSMLCALVTLAYGCTSTYPVGSGVDQIAWQQAGERMVGQKAVVTTLTNDLHGTIDVVTDDHIIITWDQGPSREIQVREIERIAIRSRSAGFWTWALIGGGTGAAVGYASTSPTALKGSGQGMSTFFGLSIGFGAGGILGLIIGQKVEYVLPDSTDHSSP